MVTVTRQNDGPVHGKGQGKIAGIVSASKRLGVTRQHLYYVLTGQRHSPPLVRRYRALKGGAK